MSNILQKSVKALREEGLRGFLKRTVRYVKRHMFGICPSEENVEEKAEMAIPKETTEQVCESKTRAMIDVLFINGCDSSVPHPARYRVTHQREQLIANNITSDEVYYVDLQIEDIKYAHLFVFFRCPYTDTIGKFIKLANELNKTVLFDIDDLVIDTKYTDTIGYIQQMSIADKELYDDGVQRMGHTLQLCEGAITTTERLAYELNKYVPEVYINRNTASEKMYALSEKTEKNRTDEEIRIGYFSGSITHNDDFMLVLPSLCILLKKYAELRLYIVGELEIPKELEPFSNQIVATPFLDWQELPQLVASVDINIAPLEQSIFNEAKSENKWVEAALVNVPTVASNVGAFARMIENGKTGYLCDTIEDWTNILELLIINKKERQKIAKQAYQYVKENCLTIYSGHAVSEYIRSKMKPSVVFVFPSTEISGGIMVALKHAAFMQKKGYDITILAYNPSLNWMEYDGCRFPVISYGKNDVFAYFDKGIATMWSTTSFVETHPKLKERYYLVQNYEVDFYEPDITLRLQANQTYNLEREIRYITISKWCQNWLRERYHKIARYAPNGIATQDFKEKTRDFAGKVRVLIEGDCAVDYKRVDESFRITNQLDKEKYEVWYMSYNEKPKEWYQYDKFLHRVAYKDVPKVYSACDILLKSSVLESFSYPPLEMMATGGFVVAVPNGGNKEYLKDEYNCLFYESGDEKQAIECIERLTKQPELRKELLQGERKTVLQREWKNIEGQVLELYGIN